MKPVKSAFLAMLPALFVAYSLLDAVSLYGEEAGFQRYDPKRKTSELVLEGSVKTWTETMDGFALYTMNAAFNGAYTFLTRHTVTMNLPYTFAWYNNAESRNPYLYSFGDMLFSYEYMKKNGRISLFAGPRFGLPLAEASEYAAREGVYQAGSGRYSAGIGISATGVRDPVVWNAGLSYDVGLPKKERFYTTLEPGNIQITAGFSDLFNERFGISAGLTQYIRLPLLYDGEGNQEDLRLTTVGRAEFLVLFEKNYIRFSIEATLYPVNSPFILGAAYGHQFDLSKER